jgi:virulence factor Mce-like protein
MMTSLVLRRVVAWGAVVALVVGSALLVKYRYGHFDDFYYVTTDMPRATQLLRTGSDVRMSGVVIGSVSDIQLVEREVQLTLQIEPQYRVPASSEAVVELKTLLGDKFVDLRYESYRPPFLQDGGSVEGSVGPELEEVLQSGVEVLESINPDDLATIIGELATGARGHGEDVARGLDANAELSGLFARTLDSQLRGLRDFRLLFDMLKTRALDLNELAEAVNQGVPVYASERAHQDMIRVLDALVPMANHFADLLIFDEDAWDRMMDRGDLVLQTIAERPDGLHDLIHGIYRYVFKLGGPPPVAPDGSGRRMAPFANFFGGDEDHSADFEASIQAMCQAMPPDVEADVLACQVVGT